MSRRRKGNFKNREIDPDEIFMDSENLPGFDRELFEGRLEKPLGRSRSYAVFVFYIVVALILLAQIGRLQILEGPFFRERAEMNHLRSESVTPKRGIIYDRNGRELAWNSIRFRVLLDTESFFVDDDNLGRAEELFLSLGKAFVKDEFLNGVRFSKERNKALVVAIEDDWNKAESIRIAFPDMPIRVEAILERKYISTGGVNHVVGYVGYPSESDLILDGEIRFEYAEDKVGKFGIERVYEEALRGEYGTRLIEVNSSGEFISDHVQKDPKEGSSVVLTIDSELSSKLYNIINNVAQERGFSGGAGIIVDLSSGELLSIVSYPEFDSNLLSRGGPREELQKLLTDSRKPFFFRALEGLYPPGSTIKPLIALAALEEGIIDSSRQIFSSGSISLPHPYVPGARSIFYDWKAHGWVDMRRALAHSSNVYFYTIGGGFEDQQGLGVTRIAHYAREFGFGKKVGIELPEERGLVPTPEWKAEYFTNDPAWRIGDTYNLSIGQGFIQVTPIQMARFLSYIVHNGEIQQFTVVQKVLNDYFDSPYILDKQSNNDKVDISKEYFDIVKEGLSLVIREGTGRGLSGLRVAVAGKTGTAEIGSGNKVDSWFIGFMPEENPSVALVIILEEGDRDNLIGAPFAASQIISWMIEHRDRYPGL